MPFFFGKRFKLNVLRIIAGGPNGWEASGVSGSACLGRGLECILHKLVRQ